MPDTIRKVDYYYVTAPDKPGEGAKLFAKLRDAGVNLLAVHAFPSARRSQIDVVPGDAVAFQAAAKAAGAKPPQPENHFPGCRGGPHWALPPPVFRGGAGRPQPTSGAGGAPGV